MYTGDVADDVCVVVHVDVYAGCVVWCMHAGGMVWLVWMCACMACCKEQSNLLDSLSTSFSSFYTSTSHVLLQINNYNATYKEI